MLTLLMMLMTVDCFGPLSAKVVTQRLVMGSTVWTMKMTKMEMTMMMTTMMEMEMMMMTKRADQNKMPTVTLTTKRKSYCHQQILVDANVGDDDEDDEDRDGDDDGDDQDGDDDDEKKMLLPPVVHISGYANGENGLTDCFLLH